MISKRRQAISDMVNQLGEVSLAQLKTSFPEVSEVTLRTDLRYLDETQQLVRVHGGAKSITTVTGQHSGFSTRSSLHQKEKELIASKAASLIRPEDSIFISAGSTCAELAKQIPEMPVYLFTDGIGTLLEIPRYPEVSAEVMGGCFDFNTMRVYGPSVIQALQNLRFSFAFIGTSGFHPDHGFGSLSSFATDTLNKVIERAEKVVVLMDSSKLNYSVAPRIIPLESVDILVTDGNLDESIVDLLQNRGVMVM